MMPAAPRIRFGKLEQIFCWFKFLSGLSATNSLQLLIEMTMEVHIKYLIEI